MLATLFVLTITLLSVAPVQAADNAPGEEAIKSLLITLARITAEQKKHSEQTEALGRELASARDQLKGERALAEQAKRALAEAAAERKKQSEQAEALARELTNAREQIKANLAAENAVRLQSEQAKVALAGVAAEQKKQSEQTEALRRELAAAREQLIGARMEAEQASRTLAEKTTDQKKQKDQSERLSRELTSARDQLNSARAEAERIKETLSAAATELQERSEETEALARELAVARDELKASIAAENAARRDSEQSKQAGASEIENLRREVAHLHAERSQRGATGIRSSEAGAQDSRSAGMADAISAEHASGPGPEVRLRSSLDRQGSERAETRMVAVTQATATGSQPALTRNFDDRKLLARAEALVRQGDIVGARILLGHTLAKGSARAAFMLAETYDSRMLPSGGAYGIRADGDKAREFYARAASAGIDAARQRMEALSAEASGPSR